MGSEVSRSYRYIVRSPDVRGGRARVEGTRVAVHYVVALLARLASDQRACSPRSSGSVCFAALRSAAILPGENLTQNSAMETVKPASANRR
jgi:uncharacterized protein DUF433